MRLFVSSLLLLAALAAFFLYRPSSIQHPHFHAGFRVYHNGEPVDFAKLEYMHLETCGEDDHEEDEQLEKAHLHDYVGDAVHVHRENATWQDLFTNLDYPLPPDLPLIAYTPGSTLSNFLESPILPNQSVLIVIGTPPPDLTNFVSLEHIQEIEAQSESCDT